MTLRTRLTLLYNALLVGILLLFGVLVYWLVSVMLYDQVDNNLARDANQLIELLEVNQYNRFETRALATFRPAENLWYQVWDAERELVFSRPMAVSQPLDADAQRAGAPLYTDNQLDSVRLRVLTIPLETMRGRVGLVQVGINLYLVDLVQSTLAVLMLIISLLAVVLGSLLIWFTTGRALAPLSSMTQMATQITRADDLSRRIPLAGSGSDEIGTLVQAFNQTLERLEQLFATQRRFLADVSHELRTPLTVIKGNVSLMRKMHAADEESLVGIDAEVDRLTRMVGDLLLLAQAESGRLPLASSPVELDTVFLEVFQQMRMLAGERLRLRIEEIDQVHISGDRDRLKQVLLNLIGNAIQYTPSGGEVVMALRQNEGMAEVTIQDSGAGIAEEDLPHIFERFYRGEKSRKRGQGSGFGLGLSIAYWIVRNHGGTIEVESREGQGTRFKVLLPIKPPSQVEAVQPDAG